MKPTILTLFLATASLLRAELPEIYYADMTFRTGHTTYLFRLADSDFKGAPAWKPGTVEPPILPNAASLAAIESLKKLRPKDWTLYTPHRVALDRSNEDPKQRYYYVVHFYRFPDSDKQAVEPLDPADDRVFTFVVLMDGRVLSPTAMRSHK